MRFDLDNVFGIHQQGLLVRAKRAELIAGNMANADTPNYRARDIDFKQILNDINNDSHSNSLTTTNDAHINPGFNIGSTSAEIMYRIPMQPSIDGNTVDTQLEKANFSENSVQYSVSAQFLTGKIKGILSALRGE
jgi:flagellar basal-body rod protein FlgB